MMMKLDGKLLLLAVLLCLPLGCEPPDRDDPTPSSQRLFIRNSKLNFAEILPEDWEYVDSYYADTNNDAKNEWIVLYHFDLPNEKSKSSGPIAAIVYQPNDKRPPDIIGYELLAQDGDFLCEYECRPSMENILSGLDGEELIVSDYLDGRVTRLTVFSWDGNERDYIPKGHFCGHRITFGQNEVRVEQPQAGRAQLMVHETYHPCNDNREFRQDPQGTPEICTKREFLFREGELRDATLSPYPEKVVLAFYNHFPDTEASTYFTEEGWAKVGQCSPNQCGCYSSRGEVDNVRVTELQPEYESYSQNKDASPDQATVKVAVVCERRDGNWESKQSMRWHLVRSADRWLLDRPE
jgi:hypothetical protein